MLPKFKLYEDIDSRKLWVAGPIDYGDGRMYFLRELTYLEDHCENPQREFGGKYLASVSVVCPEMVPQDEQDRARESWGMTPEQFAELREQDRAVLLAGYGIKAMLTQEYIGNNARTVLRDATQEATQGEFLFGFSMDRAQNRIGSTGWDCLRGDITAGLRRPPENPETALCQKIAGVNTEL